MSITLDATLKTAQDGVNHRPIVSLTSSPSQSVIPFRGNDFEESSTDEHNKNMIATSSGRLLNFYVKDGKLYLYYTNTDKTEWSTPVLIYSTGTDVTEVSSVELDSGNIGLVISREGYHLEYMIISPTGTVVTSATAIESSAGWVGKPSVILLESGTFLLIYPYGTAEPVDTGETYSLYKRTSSDFISWSSASAITLTGLTDGYYKDGCNLLQVIGGRIFLHFDYLSYYVNNVETNNIYSMYSDNDGSTWTSPTAITIYTETDGKKAVNPVAQEQSDGDVSLMWELQQNVLHFDENMDGWPGGEEFVGGSMQFNETEQRLIINNTPYLGFDNICEISTDTNTYEQYWDQSTSPSFHSDWTDADVAPGEMMPEGNTRKQSTCDLILHKVYNLANAYVLQDLTNNSMKYYHEGPIDGDILVSAGNFSVGHYSDLSLGWDWFGYGGNTKAMIRVVSEDDRRIYMVFCDTRSGSKYVVGYIDADETADPITGLYSWTELKYGSSGDSDGFCISGHVVSSTVLTGFYYIDELGYFVFTSTTGHMGTAGAGIGIMDANGNWVARQNHTVNAGMPYNGIRNSVYCNGAIYFSFDYNSSYPDQRGLGRLDLTTFIVTYFDPDWYSFSGESYLDHLLNLGDDERIAMICYYGDCDASGVYIFDTTNESWTWYNNNTLNGMYCTAGAACSGWNTYSQGALDLQYDSVNQTFFAAYPGQFGSCGIIVFSELGSFSYLKHAEITDVGTTPVYGTESTYSYYDFEYNPALVIDDDGYMWLTWDHMTSDQEYDLKWSNTMEDLDLANYLVDDSELKITWDIENPNKLSFTVSHGYLFDPLNNLSLYSVYLKKGRILTLKLGETVSGVEYFQNQGTFYVKETTLTYNFDYPVMEITAEDVRALFEDTEIVTSQYWNGTDPKTVTEELLVDHADMSASDYDIPTYEDTHDLYHQFVDMTLEEALQTIFDHFGYFPYVNVDGVFEPRQIDLNKEADHSYTDLTELSEYTPDTAYGTFVNQIIVKGMSNVYSEILYEEESVTSVSGNVGHWGGDDEITVYYSDDHQRTCRYPRLEIIQSTSDFRIWGIKGGGGEEISEIDEDETYIIIEIDAPNLTGILIAAIAALLIIGSQAVGCDGAMTGWCGAAIYACMILINFIMMILGAVATYAYNIWARPIGHERRTFQAQADDTDFQEELNGKIVTEIIDDPLCYDLASCQRVADFELSVTMAQRSRLGFRKIAHLMDEMGDKIQIIHPYSGATMDIFITNLERTVTFGKNVAMIDDIKGWKV